MLMIPKVFICIAAIMYLAGLYRSLKKRNKNGKVTFLIISLGCFVVLPFAPVDFEPELFGWVSGWFGYYLCLSAPVSDPISYLREFAVGMAHLVVVLIAHVGLALLIPGVLTRQNVNQPAERTRHPAGQLT